MHPLRMAYAGALVTVFLLGAGQSNRHNVASLPQHGQGEVCRQPDGHSVRITRDSIAYLGIAMVLDSLLSLCPDAIATSILSLHGNRYPALEFRFDGLRAWAVQWGDSLKRDEPPEYWIARGVRGELPYGVNLASRWHELKARIGEAYGSTEMGDVVISFCRAPWLVVLLDADPEPLMSPEVNYNLSAIPREAPIVAVMIGRPPMLQVGYQCVGR